MQMKWWKCLGVLVFAACGGPDEQIGQIGSGNTEFFEASPRPLQEREVTTLEIGSPAPEFRLPGVDGRFYTLSDFAKAEVLVFIFTCNHCPTAQAYEDRIKTFVADFRNRGVAVAAISPNSPLALLYEECGYSDLGDTFEEMKIRARDHQFNFPYLYDGDDHGASVKFGPVATPHAFVFDRERKLRYAGRLDSSEKPGSGNAEDLRAAVEALLAARPVPVETTKSFGCSIKWGWKLDWKNRVNREWAEAPVDLTEMEAAGVHELLRNNSGKLRLVNVWATWCGPCVIEFPELIVIHRMYQGRDFEFVSLSADSLDSKGAALAFLQDRDSAVSNFIFRGEDQYALIEAVDPDWNGALPYTVLVEPGGKVVFRHQGAIDPLEVRRAIVEHPMIGRYY